MWLGTVLLPVPVSTCTTNIRNATTAGQYFRAVFTNSGLTGGIKGGVLPRRKLAPCIRHPSVQYVQARPEIRNIMRIAK
ncbi:hypothetical protein IF1G_11349 [Cordyceps javanica]|uniref:Uncharacterized protein n=1 Tax=Cordyceps javanica TaxID=43265 RepID=A0A545UKK7_9HYPO|nr:hypothetical protein IF1G_11349 [Cordyceps javanica]